MKKADLEQMTVEQLRTVLDNIGVEYHHKSGSAKLISSILNAQVPAIEAPRAGAALKLGEEIKHTATQDLKPIKLVRNVEYPSADEVKDAIAPYIQRGVEVLQLDDEGFHFKRGYKEDSGNLKQPLRRIVECAARLVN